MNEQIRLSPILLIDENNERVGETPTRDALQRARDLGLDLVEVAADARPPVCRIMDYGKFKYEQAKKEKANKAKSKQQELKEVRLGRSLKIDPHDIAIRLKKAREFLMEGHKVQIVQNFRGREMMHKNRGYDRMNDIVKELGDIAKLEQPPRMSGRRMNMMLVPDKPKIDAILREEKKQKAAEESAKKSAADEAADAPEKADTGSEAAEEKQQPVESASE